SPFGIWIRLWKQNRRDSMSFNLFADSRFALSLGLIRCNCLSATGFELLRDFGGPWIHRVAAEGWLKLDCQDVVTGLRIRVVCRRSGELPAINVDMFLALRIKGNHASTFNHIGIAARKIGYAKHIRHLGIEPCQDLLFSVLAGSLIEVT